MKTLILLFFSATILLGNSFPALVIDPDPAGLNVRANPGDSVVGVLPYPNLLQP